MVLGANYHYNYIGIDFMFCVMFWVWFDTVLGKKSVCDSEGTLQVSPKRVYLV